MVINQVIPIGRDRILSTHPIYRLIWVSIFEKSPLFRRTQTFIGYCHKTTHIYTVSRTKVFDLCIVPESAALTTPIAFSSSAALASCTAGAPSKHTSSSVMLSREPFCRHASSTWVYNEIRLIFYLHLKNKSINQSHISLCNLNSHKISWGWVAYLRNNCLFYFNV